VCCAMAWMLVAACKREAPPAQEGAIRDGAPAPSVGVAVSVSADDAEIANGETPQPERAGAPVATPTPVAPEPSRTTPPALRELAQGPLPEVTVDEPDVIVGPLSNRGGILGEFEHTVARMKVGFRACYAREVSEDSPDEAALTLRLAIAPSGSTRTVKSDGASGLDPSTVDCIVRRAQNSTFSPPVGGEAQLVIPLTFTKTRARPGSP
jgi:hypothetical protein